MVVVVVVVGDVDGGLGHTNFLLVLGLVAGTVLTLDLVDGAVLRLFLGLMVVMVVVMVVVVVVVRFLLGVVVVKGDVGKVMGTTVNLDESLGVMGVSGRRRSEVLECQWERSRIIVGKCKQKESLPIVSKLPTPLQGSGKGRECDGTKPRCPVSDVEPSSSHRLI